MQVVSGPVGSDIRPVAPYATYGLTTDGLPDVLAVLNVLTFEERRAIRRHHLRWEGGHRAEDLQPEEAKYTERQQDDCRQCIP